ncbi:single-stranded-DNA-specific exonuclease RecJ [Oxalobacter aliiformigenes]|uniref:Single-stranded-DNA-specific exonuclease RecJ n=1 Tax=Oxalobacter aliiformigenes TaxID=2946593 RepID=A0ABY7JK42_9BURK|nr:single-stranded-DNA-specific exonuclease RecJ [Oxalobacter aliiformigenes]WAV92664.1 single-stranded-DNA-specific exonuclease RecJ [Oxalobacter aliiformigenes]WAV95829.1 single-stranded-DNA-specific exonuclease RecJ [Oxalobacter aliiformigenes]WAV96379.1 single-stranded-DNA-specific exonuclease RecJ [Oxalobacter aliiformigenes]
MTRIAVRPYSLQSFRHLHDAGIHPVLARIFAARGISELAELSTGLSGMIPPKQLLNIGKAAVFLADAIAGGRKMTVIADYDCDGATACAVALRGLKLMGAHVDFMVPNRFDNGYGLTPAIVDEAKKNHGTEVLVTVDNGIASLEGIGRAVALGMEVLVTDHHLPGDELPKNCIVVNPNQPGCPFPSKHLAGVGVMFYVLLALRAEMRLRHVFDESTQPRLDHLLDLVALGTFADVVRLDANNRILVAQGLRRIRSGIMQPGVAALFMVSGRDCRKASPFDLGFALGPRLNAAGRLSDMALGIECLLTDDVSRALQMAEELNRINTERREIEADMRLEAREKIARFQPENRATICVLSEDWHQGIIGILASRIKEKYFRPTMAFAAGKDGRLRGSGRSIPEFHMRDALDLIAKRHPGLIVQFGGHAMAAGLTLKADGFEVFSEAFEAVAKDWLTQTQLERLVETDGSLDDDCFSLDFIHLLDAQVWGHGFPPPLFCDEFTVLNQRILKDRHLKLQLEKNGRHFDAIQFGSTTMLPRCARLAYRLDANEYNGRTSVQLLVEHAEDPK